MVRRSFAIALLFALPACAQDEADDDPWQPEIAAHLSGHHGLTGFGSMVDGRIPSPLLVNPNPDLPGGAYSARFTARARASQRRRYLRGSAGKYTLRERRQTLIVQHGVTVRGLDLTVGLPYAWEATRFRLDGAPDPSTDRDAALGDVFVGAKLGLRIPKFFFGEWAIAAVGIYALGRVPVHTAVSEPAEIEYGIAVAGPYGYSFRYNGNLAILQREEGVAAIVFRAGGSAVPLAGSDLTVRGYAYMVGTQHEGRHRPGIDVELGAQALVFEALTFEVGASVRVLEDEFVERGLRRAIFNGLGGERIRRVRDTGSFTLTFGVGIVL